MKRSAVLTLKVPLRRKIATGHPCPRRSASLQPLMPTLPPCEALVFLEWLAACNVDGDSGGGRRPPGAVSSPCGEAA